MFKGGGGSNFRTDLKWLAYKIWMLNFQLVGRKFARCIIAVQNSINLLESKLFKTSGEFIIINKNRFS